MVPEWKLLTIFGKNSILDILQGCEYSHVFHGISETVADNREMSCVLNIETFEYGDIISTFEEKNDYAIWQQPR